MRFRKNRVDANSQRNPNATTAKRRRIVSRACEVVEPLESRVLLSSIVVNTLADGSSLVGVTSLRMAINTADSSSSPTTITFDPTVFATHQTIVLDGTELEFSNTKQPITITGPAPGVTISGNNLSRVIQIDSSVTATLSNVIVTEGSNRGIYSDPNSVVTLTNDSVTNCVGVGGIRSCGQLTLDNVTVSGNSDSGVEPGDYRTGGGICVASGTATLINVTVSDNTASNPESYACGGGIFNYGTATLTNVTVFGNTVSNTETQASGGGIYNSGTATLTNVTVSGNSVSCAATDDDAYGGGIYNAVAQAAFTIANTIVAANTATTGGPDVYGDFNSKGYNLIGETDGSAGFNVLDHTGTSASTLNADLDPLANNGGPTQTILPVLGSPAIDAGLNAIIPSAITTDQRGLPRIADGTVDIGACEYQPVVLSVSPAIGSVVGDAKVTITGLSLAGATAADFGATSAAILSNTDTQITAMSPAESAGNVDVTVITPFGTSATSSADHFTYAVLPLVAAVSSTMATGTYGAGAAIPVAVALSEPVNVSGAPQLMLNDGGVASYAGGGGSSILTFTYIVAVGQNTSDLDYASTAALALNGGSVSDQSGNTAVLTLPATGTDGLAMQDIVINTVAVPSGVSSTRATGTYGAGTTIPITVTFNEPVNVSGALQLMLNDGGVANYTGGGGSSILTFTYIVAVGQNTSDLDYASTAALALNGGSVSDQSGNTAVLTLPATGADGLAMHDIVINTVAVPSGVSSTRATGTYGAGTAIPIAVTFSETVNVSGTPQLVLNDGGLAKYASGSGTPTLMFTYTVTAGQNTSDLDYASTGALSLNSGSIKDQAGDAAVLTLPASGADGLAAKNIVISTTSQAVPLPAPTLSYPSDAATGISTTPTFGWSQVTGNQGYRIVVSSNSADLTTNPTQTGNTSPANGFNINTIPQNTTSYTWSGALRASTTYYWEVHALSSDLATAGNWAQGSFTTAAATGPTYILGADFNADALNADWSDEVSGRRSFLYIKAAQGDNTNTFLPPNITSESSQTNATVFGVFDFADPDEYAAHVVDRSLPVTDPNDPAAVKADAQGAAESFYDNAKEYLAANNLLPALDLEADQGSGGFSTAWTMSSAGWTAMADWVNAWTTQFQMHMPGVYPILYMDESYASNLAQTQLLNQDEYRLWIAIAGNGYQPTEPVIPLTSDTYWPWAIEQYNTTGPTPPGDLDALNPSTVNSLGSLEIGADSAASFATLTNGALNITALSAPSTIGVSLSGTTYIVTENGLTPEPFTASQVTQINIQGSSGNDSITVDSSVTLGVSVQGGPGDDTVTGGSGDDGLCGGQGNDVIYGDAGDDSIKGGQGDDLLCGGKGDDTIFGSLGNDTLRGGLGDDSLNGGAGTNQLYGGQGNNTFYAVNGTQDQLFAGAATNDSLFYGPNDNYIVESGTIPPGNVTLA